MVDQQLKQFHLMGSLVLKLGASEKDGFKFQGWFLEVNHVTLVTNDYFVKNPINDSIKLYAKFDKLSYGVMFYVNDTLDKTVQVLYQESISYQLDNPLFLGWSLTANSNEVINKDYVVTKEVSLYAVFKSRQSK